MDGEATPTATSVTETTAPNDGISETALGGAVAEPQAAPEGVDAAEAEAAPEAPEGKEGGENSAPVVPEKYELTGTEGASLDAASLEAATPVFQELGLSNDQAQKLIPVAEQFAASIRSQVDQQILANITAERAAWLNEAKADPEIGGAAFDSNMVVAAKALDTLGFAAGSPFRNLLNESGLGNHPEMIRAFVKVGKAISEDSDFPRGGVATTGVRTLAETLYPPKP